MTEKRQKAADPALTALAQEELAGATTLGWRALASVTPWGDTYEGFAPDGRTVHIERAYLWRGAPRGDILVEIAVYADEIDYDQAVRVSAVLQKP